MTTEDLRKNVPQFEGMFCQDANAAIIDYLKELGVLLGTGEITHSYPTLLAM